MSKTLKFVKMHGAGNDYIYVDCLAEELKNPEALAVKMSPRHLSVGADGLVLICPSKVAVAKMRMFNADGSEGKMCGNAIRCVGKYLFDNRVTDKTEISVETLSGIKKIKLNVENGKVASASVDMGTAELSPDKIPVLSDGELIDAPMEVNGVTYRLTAVSMGNPHAVVYLKDVDYSDVDSVPLEKVGPVFENLSIFPERVNTEFVEIIDAKTLKMRVWERGSGETYACGTGACAAVAASCVNRITPFGEEITVKLKGGELKIVCYKNLKVVMTGGAEKVYDGVYEYED